MEKKNIRHFTPEQLKEVVTEMKQPAFRGGQIHEWLWKKNVSKFEEMTNLPKPMIAQLEAEYFIPSITLKREQKSTDGTVKVGYALFDNNIVESVLIPQSTRMTACISSQVGCSLDCAFCATGKMKKMRNLTADEMYDQVKLVNDIAVKEHSRHLSNVVYMGMGEPLLNYRETLDSIAMITSKSGMGMSPKRITVSTAGIAKMIKRLGDDKVKFNLALSLHAANDKKRNEIMAINESNNLEILAEALKYFQERTGTRITFEYIVFKNFNDDLQDAKELAEFCKNVACKINLIEYNPIEGLPFTNADRKKIDAFSDYLISKNMIVNVRRSRGKDIDAACGQLANKVS